MPGRAECDVVNPEDRIVPAKIILSAYKPMAGCRRR
jgi:hypothetical protein